jgi:hypothetical protein
MASLTAALFAPIAGFKGLPPPFIADDAAAA